MARDRDKQAEVDALNEENRKEIAVRVGTEFSIIAAKFLPVMGEALGRSEKEISFGCTVKMRQVKNNLVICRVVAHEPKIPTAPIDDVNFVCERSRVGDQLAFVWNGTLKEFRDELKERDVTPDPMPGDDYDPSKPDESQ